MPSPAATPPFERALCAVDGTPDSLAAVEQAAALTGPGGRLTVLIATSFRREGSMRSPEIGPARATEILDQALAIASATGVSTSVEVDPSAPPAELILARSSDHDLLALGAPESPSLIGSIFMDSVTAAAEELLPTPLLVSRRLDDAAGSSPRVLVASDGLDDSDSLVHFAARLAGLQSAATTLVHILGAESHMHPHRLEHQAELLARAPAAGVSSELRVEVGNPRHVIVELARELGASLILMGSRRRSGLQALGSVSRPVVAHAHCPVLLMPPELLPV